VTPEMLVLPLPQKSLQEREDDLRNADPDEEQDEENEEGNEGDEK
jgi:hypothetical protein